MEKLWIAVATAAGKVARARPVASLRARVDAGLTGADDQHGQGLAEYALILALIAIMSIAALVFMGTVISDMFWDPISEDFGAVLSRLGILVDKPT
jgi:Flp pilus assembly pilin Flp